MPSFRTLLRENIAFLALSFTCFSVEPAIVHAQGGDYNPVPFTDTLSLSRGSVSPVSGDAIYLTESDRCRLVTQEWGWGDCTTLDALIINQIDGVDTTLIEKPTTDGYVQLDDWQDQGRDDAIREIEAAMAEGLVAQSEATGQKIEFKGWRVYPTLDQEGKFLYYATDLSWDGEMQTNVKAVVFDRRGYVTLSYVPIDGAASSETILALTKAVLQTYQSTPTEAYSAFVTGDKVAAVGAVGVLATLVGVKYGKTAFAGFLAIAALVLKKAWFLLAVPLLAIGRLFRKKPTGQA